MSVCPRCSAAFSCCMEDGDRRNCWCMHVPALPANTLQEVKAAQGQERCLCPACLQALAGLSKQAAASRP